MFVLDGGKCRKETVCDHHSMRCNQTKEMRRVFNITGVLPQCRKRTDGLAVSVLPDVLKVTRD